MAFRAPDHSTINYDGEDLNDLLEGMSMAEITISPSDLASVSSVKAPQSFKRPIADLMKISFRAEGLRYKDEWLSVLVHRAEKSARCPTQDEVDMFALGVAQEKVYSAQEKMTELIEVLKNEVSKLQVVSKDIKDFKKIGKDALLEITSSVKDHLSQYKSSPILGKPESSQKTEDCGPAEEKLQLSEVLKLVGFARDIYDVEKNREKMKAYILDEESARIMSGALVEEDLRALRNIIVGRVKSKKTVN